LKSKKSLSLSRWFFFIRLSQPELSLSAKMMILNKFEKNVTLEKGKEMQIHI